MGTPVTAAFGHWSARAACRVSAKLNIHVLIMLHIDQPRKMFVVSWTGKDNRGFQEG